MWRLVEPQFRDEFKTVLFDHVGAGGSDLIAYSRGKYSSLQGYADAMIGALASTKAPALFGKLVLVGPSPRYINDEDYTGGFSEAQIEELLEFLDSNHMEWSNAMAPVIMGNADRPDLGSELANSFCRTDPEIAKHFARTTFTSDNRPDLKNVTTPALILQCSEDVIAPLAVALTE